MSIDILFVILLAWVVAGLFAAIAFGRAIRQNETDDETIAPAEASIKYLRRQQHKHEMERAQHEGTSPPHHVTDRVAG